MSIKTPVILGAIAALVMLSGCDKPAASAPTKSARPDAAERVFDTRGVVRSVPEGGQTIVVRHEEIPDYMPRMTMELNVRDPKEIAGLERNDEITFQLVATADTHWIRGIKRVGKVEEVAAPEPVTPQLVRELDAGDELPDYEMLTEQGRTIRFSEFRGQALAFTFIFSRCPLPDYCPRMGNNFATARELLLTNAPAQTNWQFLCLSFDPEYDTPEVLRIYARNYRHNNPDRWLFAVASQKVLRTLAPELELMLAREEGGSISHNLRTVVLDPKGRIYQIFAGNKWTPQELADAMHAAAKQ